MRPDTAKLDSSSTVVASKAQVSAELTADSSGQAVILNLKKGIYYELNDVGASIWRLIQEPRSVDSVLEALVATYEVSREQCEADLLDLLREMAGQGLLEIRNA